MFDQDVVFEDPISAMVYSTIDMSFLAAHSFAAIWGTAHRKNTDIDALKPAQKSERESDPMSFAHAA